MYKIPLVDNCKPWCSVLDIDNLPTIRYSYMHITNYKDTIRKMKFLSHQLDKASGISILIILMINEPGDTRKHTDFILLQVNA